MNLSSCFLLPSFLLPVIWAVSKKRFNYASFDCAARILGHNKGARSASSILVDQKDSYLLNLCSYNDKHVIVELCQDIKLDTLILANYELFSSMVKDFEVSVSKKFPPTQPWRSIGNFTAQNTRQEQEFVVERPPNMFARFLRLDFKTHYGNEFYCPISVIKVHGKTMMDDFEESKVITEKQAEAFRASPGEEVLKSKETLELFQSKVILNDQWELFRGMCSVVSLELQRYEQQSDDDQQENIFKAIYDRLDRLEGNTTLQFQQLGHELHSLDRLVRQLASELGTVEAGNRLHSYRTKLRVHLYQRIDDRLGRVDAVLSRMQRRDWWLMVALLCLLLIVISLLRRAPRVNRDLAVRGIQNVSGRDIQAQTVSDLAAREMSDQTVPPFEPASSETPSLQTPSFEALPLLLEDQEADLVDARYVATPTQASKSTQASMSTQASKSPSS